MTGPVVAASDLVSRRGGAIVVVCCGALELDCPWAGWLQEFVQPPDISIRALEDAVVHHQMVPRKIV